MLKASIKAFKYIIRRLARTVELSQYNDFTIAAYFREQGAIIGENNRIEIRSLGTEPYLIKIGNHCTVAPGVCFLTHDGGIWLFTEEYPGLQKFGTIEILDNCFIGLNAVLLGNIKIGPNSIVGTGSIVTKDVPPNTVVAGNPARFICSIDEYREKALDIWLKQKPPGYFEKLQEGKIYSPETIQQMKYEESWKLREHLIEIFGNDNALYNSINSHFEGKDK